MKCTSCGQEVGTIEYKENSLLLCWGDSTLKVIAVRDGDITVEHNGNRLIPQPPRSTMSVLAMSALAEDLRGAREEIKTVEKRAEDYGDKLEQKIEANITLRKENRKLRDTVDRIEKWTDQIEEEPGNYAIQAIVDIMRKTIEVYK